MQPLTGRTALVCGGTQGIGWASAQALATEGARVLILARDAQLLAQRVAALPTVTGGAHAGLSADLQDLTTLEAAWAPYHAETVHILVNNTGGPPGGPLLSASEADLLRPFTAQLLASHWLAQRLVPSMRRAGYGRILNIISTSVKVPLRGLGVSNSIRGAVANWAKTLATELAPEGITVNNILPGATRTGRLEQLIQRKATQTGLSPAAVEAEMRAEIPMGRFATPEEIAAVVAFLASPAAAYITGINVPVDGGRTGCL